MDKETVLNYFIAVVIGMWISVICLSPQMANKNDKIQQLKQENDKLTNIIIELNEE